MYGFWSYFVFAERMTRMGWQDMADLLDSSIGTGFITFSILLRLASLPQMVYQQVLTIKMIPLRKKHMADNMRAK